MERFGKTPRPYRREDSPVFLSPAAFASRLVRVDPLRPLYHWPQATKEEFARVTLPASAKRRCSWEGCRRLHAAHGFCDVHYAFVRHPARWEHLLPEGARLLRCEIPGCDKPQYAKGVCRGHYATPPQTHRQAPKPPKGARAAGYQGSHDRGAGPAPGRQQAAGVRAPRGPKVERANRAQDGRLLRGRSGLSHRPQALDPRGSTIGSLKPGRPSRGAALAVLIPCPRSGTLSVSRQLFPRPGAHHPVGGAPSLAH